MRELVVDQKITLDGVFDKLEEWQMRSWEDRDEMLRYAEDH